MTTPPNYMGRPPRITRTELFVLLTVLYSVTLRAMWVGVTEHLLF